MTQTENFVLLNKEIHPGETKTVNLKIAQLHTMTELKIPIIVSYSTRKGPVVLLSAGLHGDELNGIEIVRQMIVEKINRPQIGTIICMPLINIFGFVGQTREFPDGRDLNRVFPGSANGSLASQFAYNLMEHIVPLVDYVIDFHAGGRARFNVPHVRVQEGKPELKEMADAFQAPFLMYSDNLGGSFREACDLAGVKYLLFEGGKSLDINSHVVEEAIAGTKRFLHHLGMLKEKFEVPQVVKPMICIESSYWIRADLSGLFRSIVPYGKYVEEGETIAWITDPYGFVETPVLAPNSGYIINENQGPIVYQGDAIFNISTRLKE
ncbi:succinylglutamate desuccinylase/aspartoacylase family protein [Moheibacter stercoris]|uniref:Deacylase n=1 Tax=Moheibacter stercoris TaxID=1628251 RepID=A0ABV2LSD1_9FLAO